MHTKSCLLCILQYFYLRNLLWNLAINWTKPNFFQQILQSALTITMVNLYFETEFSCVHGLIINISASFWLQKMQLAFY